MNETVLVELEKKGSSSHHRYDPELRTKVGRYVASSGNKAAVTKYCKELGRPVSESTVWSIKKAYYLAVQQWKEGPRVTQLDHGL